MMRSDGGDPAYAERIRENEIRRVVNRRNFGREWGNFENAYLSVGGKMFEYPLVKSIPMLEGPLNRRPLMQEGNKMNEAVQFEWSETGFGSIELFCRACGQVVASDLRTKSAMIYRGLQHRSECTANPSHQSGSDSSGPTAK
jgi:hypothetical protein